MSNDKYTLVHIPDAERPKKTYCGAKLKHVEWSRSPVQANCAACVTERKKRQLKFYSGETSV